MTLEEKKRVFDQMTEGSGRLDNESIDYIYKHQPTMRLELQNLFKRAYERLAVDILTEERQMTIDFDN